MVDMEREARVKAMEAYKALVDFMVKKALAVVAVRMSKKLYDDHYQFSKEAFMRASS